jgi:hypothetical protein
MMGDEQEDDLTKEELLDLEKKLTNLLSNEKQVELQLEGFKEQLKNI